MPTHRFTWKSVYLFTLMLLFRLTIKTYLSPQLLLYLPIDISVHDSMCSFHTYIPINGWDLPVNVSTALHVRRRTWLSVYLLSLFLPFWHNMHNFLSTHLLGYVHTNPPGNKSGYLLCLRTKTYLSPQLHAYLPLNVPVHDPTCLFWLFHSDKPFVLTCPLT